MDLLSGPAALAKQIADAVYEPSSEQLRVWFRDGTTAEIEVGP